MGEEQASAVEPRDKKVRKTLTLDKSVVEAFGNDNAAMSTVVNQVLLEEVARRRRRRGLAELVDELEAKYGPADPAEVERIRGIFDELNRA